MKRTIILLIVSIVVFNLNIFSQNKISGKVFDDQGNPLPGAEVFLPELLTGVITDQDGYFSIENIPAGNFIIKVSFLGYQTITVPVAVHDSIRLDFQLEPAHMDIREVVVTGVAEANDVMENPAPVDILKQDFIDRHAAESVNDLLQKLPNVDIYSTGVAISKPVIRGLTGNRVIIIKDDIRQESQQWGDEHGFDIPVYLIQRIELLRGPASLMYGSDGMGGAINVITGRKLLNNTYSAGLQAAYESNNHRMHYNGIAGLKRKGRFLTVGGSWSSAGDYTNAIDGRVFNSGFKDWTVYGQSGKIGSKGLIRSIANASRKTVELPEGERDSTGGFLTGEAPLQKITNADITIPGNVQIRNSMVRFSAAYQYHQRQEIEASGEPPELDMALHTGSLNVKWKRHFTRMQTVVAGISQFLQLNRNLAEERLIPDYMSYDIGGFLFNQHGFNNVTLHTGLRMDARFLDSEAFGEHGEQQFQSLRKTYFSLSGSVGVAVQPLENLSLKINAAKGFRNPNIAELTANGVHEGTFRYEIGNPQLKPESNYELDGVLWFAGEHLHLYTSAFVNYIRNYIYLDRLSALAGGDSVIHADGESFPAFQYRQDDALIYGGEATLDIHPHPLDWLHLEQTLGMVFARRLQGSGKYLPFIPPPEYRIELYGAYDTRSDWLRKITGGIAFEYHFQQNRIVSENDFETPTPAYYLLNLDMKFLIGIPSSQNTRIEFHAGIHNLLDKAYQSHLSRLKYAPVNPATGKRGIYEMGRNFRVGLKMYFDGKLKP